MKCPIWLILILLASLPVMSVSNLEAADTIYQYNSGSPLLGDIKGYTKTELTLQRGTKSVKIPANEVQRIRWNGEPPQLNIARNQEANGNYAAALDEYKKAQAKGSANLKKDLQFLIARATSKNAFSNPADLDGGIKMLDTFVKSNGDHYRYYPAMKLLGEAHLAKKDYTAANTAFGTVERSPWKDYQMDAKNMKARVMLAQGNIKGALVAFNTVAKMDAKTEPEQASKRAAQLGSALCLEKDGKQKEAIKILDEIIKTTSSQQSPLLAEAYLRKGDCFRELGEAKEALIAYLHIDVLFPKEPAIHAEALYHLSTLWGKVQKPERGVEARAVLQQQYPNSEWAKKAAGS
ncbi:MAG: tetratricopeptide repeat protein [Planctomycetes bacterium]|nr:tetratricopeptide repeat protein [Planctomycetota bacterium]MCH9727667.1 tetratricopeptide repeat protein [Planctomycetota bacterium]MCH9789717.1 tetratricopeptide repeat protein [Planctomycetota bacterium]MDF1744969.1 tetratricopeptide repeat protein [Gimesia sp.]